MKNHFLIAFLVMISPLLAVPQSRAELIAEAKKNHENMQKSYQELNNMMRDVKHSLELSKHDLESIKHDSSPVTTNLDSIQEELGFLVCDITRLYLVVGLAAHLPAAHFLDIAVVGVTGINPYLLEINGALLAGSLLMQPILTHEKNDFIIKKRIEDGLMTRQEIKDYNLRKREERRVFDEASIN